MIANGYLEEAARELLEREVAVAPEIPLPGQVHGSDLCQESGVFWLLPELVHRLEESRDQPIDSLAPLIRRRLLDHCFVDENGDSVVEASLHAAIEQRVSQLLHVLERVRGVAQEHGLWCDAPITPIMFG